MKILGKGQLASKQLEGRVEQRKNVKAITSRHAFNHAINQCVSELNL